MEAGQDSRGRVITRLIEDGQKALKIDDEIQRIPAFMLACDGAVTAGS